MKLEGSHPLPGPRDRVWDLLMDPDVLVAAIPGCDAFERLGEDRYKGTITAKLGPVQSTYTTTFEVRDKEKPDSYRLLMEGQAPGGFVNANVRMRLAPGPAGNGYEETTVLHYDADAQVGGKIARIGQRMVQAGANMIIKHGFKELSERIETELQE